MHGNSEYFSPEKFANNTDGRNNDAMTDSRASKEFVKAQRMQVIINNDQEDEPQST